MTRHAEDHSSEDFTDRFNAGGILMDPAAGEPWYNAENISLFPCVPKQPPPQLDFRGCVLRDCLGFPQDVHDRETVRSMGAV